MIKLRGRVALQERRNRTCACLFMTICSSFWTEWKMYGRNDVEIHWIRAIPETRVDDELQNQTRKAGWRSVIERNCRHRERATAASASPRDPVEIDDATRIVFVCSTRTRGTTSAPESVRANFARMLSGEKTHAGFSLFVARIAPTDCVPNSRYTSACTIIALGYERAHDQNERDRDRGDNSAGGCRRMRIAYTARVPGRTRTRVCAIVTSSVCCCACIVTQRKIIDSKKRRRRRRDKARGRWRDDESVAINGCGEHANSRKYPGPDRVVSTTCLAQIYTIRPDLVCDA